MNFPLQYPLFQFFYWLVNTPSVGGVIVILVGGACTTGAFLLLRWISLAAKSEASEAFSFPDFSADNEE